MIKFIIQLDFKNCKEYLENNHDFKQFIFMCQFIYVSKVN